MHCNAVVSVQLSFIGVEQMTGGQDEAPQEAPTTPGQRVHSHHCTGSILHCTAFHCIVEQGESGVELRGGR